MAADSSSRKTQMCMILTTAEVGKGREFPSAPGKHYMGAFCSTCTTFEALHTSLVCVCCLNVHGCWYHEGTVCISQFKDMISKPRQYVHKAHFWQPACKLGFSCVQESARLRLYQLLLPLPRPGASTSTSRADTRAALAPHNHQHHHWLRTLGLESRGHLSPGLRHARICPALALERARAGRQSRGVCCRGFIIMGGEG